MLVVIFEVWPGEDRREAYFDRAADLRDDLEKIDGFISVERFESVTEPGKFLSLSFWRDEEAIETWYAHAGHGKAQREGREFIFKDYRIRVARVLRDYDMDNGRPTDNRR